MLGVSDCKTWPSFLCLPLVCIDRVAPFLSVLEKAIEDGPSYFVALVTLNLSEVSPRPAHLTFMVTAARAWMRSFAQDTEFWVDHGIGRRICVWLQQIHQRDHAALFDEVLRSEVNRLLSALVSLGVPEATRLEKTLGE